MAFGFSTDPCATKECPKGSKCKVFEPTGEAFEPTGEAFEPTGEAFCDPSCDIDNGGCDEDQRCILALPVCANPPVQPCVGLVTCEDIGIVNMCAMSKSAFEHLAHSQAL